MKIENNLVPVELVRILISECDGDHQIVFKEIDGERQLPVAIGPFEALAINSSVNGQTPPRPMTHDLMVNIIDSLGGILNQVVIDQFTPNEDGVSGTFHAKLVLLVPSGEKKWIDCRPSDAVALAVRLDVPLAVAEKVLKSQSVTQ